MMKAEFFLGLIAMLFSLVVSIKILSDLISERSKEKKILKVVFTWILSVGTSFGLATFMEYYYLYNFKLWRVFLDAFCLFSIYFGVSILVGLYKMRKDERRLKKKHNTYNKYSRRNSARQFDNGAVVYRISGKKDYKL